MNAIENLPYEGGKTDTTTGLHTMGTQVFGVDGDRPLVNNTCVIITDGVPTEMETVQAAVDEVHSRGITTYAIGVTNQVNAATLKLLSSPPHEVRLKILEYLVYGRREMCTVELWWGSRCSYPYLTARKVTGNHSQVDKTSCACIRSENFFSSKKKILNCRRCYRHSSVNF